MNRRSILKVLAVSPLAAMPGAVQARTDVETLSDEHVDLMMLKEIIERNELPWEAMTKKWDEGKSFGVSDLRK